MMTTLEILKQSLAGECLQPGESGYDQLKNTFVTKGSPAYILRPKTTQDVVLCIRFAKEQSLKLSVRSGGHSGVGFSTNNEGVVVDLSLMNQIEIVDPANNIVKIQGGANWGSVADFLHGHQLAISSGDTKSVGVGGLTLGGGIGWMVRKYGLAIDQLVCAEIVTAEGDILRTDAKDHADLFWGIRGGGGNFGVVTSFEFAAHVVPEVVAGSIVYPIELLSQVFKGWRDYLRIAPEELSSTLLVMPSFGGNPAAVMILCCCSAEEAEAVKIIEPLGKLGVITHQDIKKKPYTEMLDEAHPLPDTMRVIASNSLVDEITDELITTIVNLCGKGVGPIIQVRSLGGAMKRIDPMATAFAYRHSEAMIVGAIFTSPTATDTAIQEALKPWDVIAAFGNGAYVNFLSTATEVDVAHVYPKETYQKLVALKKTYDPENLFSQNHNIKPV